MKGVVASFLQLPLPVIYAILAALGAGGGTLIGKFLGKIFKAPKVSLVVAILGGVLALQVARSEIPELRRAVIVDAAWKGISENRLFAALIKYHPDAAAKFRGKIELFVRVPDSRESRDELLIFAQTLTLQYLLKDVPRASNDAVHRMMVQENSVIKRLQHRPDLCVAFAFGKIRFPLDPVLEPIWKEMLPEAFDIKADIIESAFAEQGESPMNQEELFLALEAAYRKNGYGLDELAGLASADTLPPEKACALLIRLSDVVLSLEPDFAAEIYKSMVYHSTTAK